MDSKTDVQLQPVSRPKAVLLLVAWCFVFVTGTWITAYSCHHIASDTGRFDARLRIPVTRAGSEKVAPFRSLTSGDATLFAATYVQDPPTGRAFAGDIEIWISEDGQTIHQEWLGRRGTRFVLEQDSNWSALGKLTTPALWLRAWTVHAVLRQPDPSFPAQHIDVILRKDRPDLGMGGMLFYVTVFVGQGLLSVANILALLLPRQRRFWPVALSMATTLASIVVVWG